MSKFVKGSLISAGVRRGALPDLHHFGRKQSDLLWVE